MTYLSVVAADTPIHWWRMADAGGPLAHDIGSATPCTLGSTTGAGFPYEGVVGLDGGSFACHGGRLRSPGGVALPGTGWSIESWSYLTSALGFTSNQVIFNLQDDTNNVVIRTWAQTDGKMGSAGTFFANQLSAAALAYSRWHHIVYEFTGAARNTYIDGALLASVASGAFGAANYRVDIGSNGGGTELCVGFAAEIAVYNYALGAAKVSNHFLAFEGSPTSPPVFRNGGTVGTGLNGGAPYTDLELAIWNAVHKAY